MVAGWSTIARPRAGARRHELERDHDVHGLRRGGGRRHSPELRRFEAWPGVPEVLKEADDADLPREASALPQRASPALQPAQPQPRPYLSVCLSVLLQARWLDGRPVPAPIALTNAPLVIARADLPPDRLPSLSLAPPGNPQAMASSPPRRGSRASADAPAQPAAHEADPQPSSVEMSNLTPQSAPEPDSSIPPVASTPNATPQDSDVQHDAPQQPSPEPALVRSETEAIGPASDTPAAKPDPASGPQVVITLLLTSGARHPYKIDEKYLRKRNVTVENMDPFNISVYTLKELIWRDWREGAMRAIQTGGNGP